MSEKNKLFIDSEIGELEEVIIHAPGREIEVITPLTAEKLLYNDILPLSVVKKEYTILKSFLSCVANTVEISSVLQKVLENHEAREEIIRSIQGTEELDGRKGELYSCSSGQLMNILIEGLKSKKDTLSSFLSDNEFDYFPLPNIYFTRDSSMVFRDFYITGSMAHNVRKSEAILLKQIFKQHYGIDDSKNIFDGTQFSDSKIRIEGGDFLVFSRNILIIGLSERTSSQAVDLVMDSLYSAVKEPLRVYCVMLPAKRETIHLDMIFNIINREEVLIYEPYITGEWQLRFVRIDIDKNGEKSIKIIKNLLDDLKESGFRLDAVLCGGSDERVRQREQWLSGNNFFAFAPGKIIGYDCNEATLASLQNNGYKICQAESFISGADSTDNYTKLAVTIPGTDLARGGGGVRCMTLPVRRKSFNMGGTF